MLPALPHAVCAGLEGAVWKGQTRQLGEVEGLLPPAEKGHPSPFPPASWAREADVLLGFSPHRSALARFTCGQELGLHLSVEVTEA